jgi:hypothetical protein
MSKRIAIGVDSGGNHISSIACHIEKKKYVPENQSQNDLGIQGTFSNHQYLELDINIICFVTSRY